MKCPQCGGECWREDIGVQRGPWRCDCGWSTYQVNEMVDTPIEMESETTEGFEGDKP